MASSGGTVLIRLQNLAWSANSSDIRRFFNGLAIPEGGVHIVGGDRGDAFVTFTSDETARLALLLDGQELSGQALKLFVSSPAEMQHVIQQARLALAAPGPEEPEPPTTPTPPLLREQLEPGQAKQFARADPRTYPRQRYYPDTDPRRAGNSRPGRSFPPDTAVAAYEDSAMPPEKRQRLANHEGYGGRAGVDYVGHRRYHDDQQQPAAEWRGRRRDGYGGHSNYNGAESYGDSQPQHRQPYWQQAQHQHHLQQQSGTGEDYNQDYSSYADARRWDANPNRAESSEADYNSHRQRGFDRAAADAAALVAGQNAYSNIYGSREASSTAAPAAYSSSRDPRLAGRYRQEPGTPATAGQGDLDSAANAAATEQSAASGTSRSSFYNEQRDPRFKGELYNSRDREIQQPTANQQQPPIGSPRKGSDWSGGGDAGRGEFEADYDDGYEYYGRPEYGPQRGRYPPRPFDDRRQSGPEAELDYDSGNRRRPYNGSDEHQYGWGHGGEDYYHEAAGRGGGYPVPRRGRGGRGGRGGGGEFHDRGGGRGFFRGRGGRGRGGPPNGFEGGGFDSYEGSYRPKPWRDSPTSGGGVHLLPQPPVGDDQSVAAAFRRLLHPGRPKSLLGPAALPRHGPLRSGPHYPGAGRRPEFMPRNGGGASADAAMAAVAAASRDAALSEPQPWQPPLMPELPKDEPLPDYVKGPRDEHFIALAGLPLDADYSDACAALPGIRLALTDVKFETDALGRRTGQAFVRLAEPADVLRALSQSGASEISGGVRVSASCEHEFRCASDPDFAGDEDDPDIGGGCGDAEFPARPSPYYLDCCLEVNGLPQPIVAEDLLTVFDGDRSIADPREDLYLDRSKDPRTVTAYLRFDGFERFAEASRCDIAQLLAPGTYLVAISRLQFASYRAAAQRQQQQQQQLADSNDFDEDNDDLVDFRRPPIGFQQQQKQRRQAGNK